jgi:hypothetical protein
MPRPTDRRPRWSGRLTCVALAVGWAALLAGCLGKPSIEDRWTRVDLLAANHAPGQVVAPGVSDSFSLSTTITYRSIVTGFAIAELRASGTLSPASVTLDPHAPRAQMAADIDRILAHSVSMGRSTRAITGWDHLIQRIDFSFRATAPASMDTSVAPGGTPAGLFLLCYLGSGQKVERTDGTDTLLVTPFNSSQYEILPVGMALALPAPAPR